MTRNASNTAAKITVNVPPDSPQGIRGEFPLLISGWEWATKDPNIQGERVGLIVKVSGYNPAGRQKPELHEYGKMANGCRPEVIHYPIAHENCWKARPDLSEKMAQWWLRDHAVLFHCNKGEVRAPTAACVMMGYITRRDPKSYLPVVMKVRRVDKLLVQIQHQVNILGNLQWFPDQWQDYVIQCRLMHCQARWKDFRFYYKHYRRRSPPRDRFYGSTPVGTPRGAGDPREQRLQFDDSTPRGVANPSGGRSPRVVNPEYRPLWECRGIDHPPPPAFPPPPSTPPPATGSATPPGPPGPPLGGLGSAGQWLGEATHPHEKVYQKPRERSRTPTPRGACEPLERSRSPTPRQGGQPYWPMDDTSVDAGLPPQDWHMGDTNADAGLPTPSFADVVAAMDVERLGGAMSSGQNRGDDASTSEVTFMQRHLAPHVTASGDDDIPLGWHPCDNPMAHANPGEDPAAVHYDPPPNKVRAIEDSELSDDLKVFLEVSHWRGNVPAGKNMWRYSERSGLHPLHSMCDVFGGRPANALRKLYNRLPPAPGLTTRSEIRDNFPQRMKQLWREAVKHSSVEYGDQVTMRTMHQHPPNNTALMMMAKAAFKEVHEDDYQDMICQLLEAGGDLFAVDNRRTNAFMHSAGSGNTLFFMLIWDRAEYYYRELRFPFDHRNCDGRNALDLVNQAGAPQQIFNKCLNLVHRGFMTYSRPDHNVGRFRPGGTSTANRRNRALPAVEGTARYDRQVRGSCNTVANRWRGSAWGWNRWWANNTPWVAHPVPPLNLGAAVTRPATPPILE